MILISTKMQSKKEIFPEWLFGYQICDFRGGFKGLSKTSRLGDELELLKERFPDGWFFTATSGGDLPTSIMSLRGMVAVQNPDAMGAIYREKSGELVKAKFSVRTLFSKYDSLRDSLLTKDDQEIIEQMYKFDVDLICEVEVLSGLPVLNLMLRERAGGGGLSIRYLDSGKFDPSKLGTLDGFNYPIFEFVGTLGYLKKMIYLRIFEDRVSIGIIEDRGGGEDTRMVSDDDYREMFEINRQNLELSRFGDRLIKKPAWMPGDIDELNEVFASVCPDFVYEPL